MEMDVVRELPSLGNETLCDLAALALVLHAPPRGPIYRDRTLPKEVHARLYEWSTGWSPTPQRASQALGSAPLWQQAPFRAAARDDPYVYAVLRRHMVALHINKERAYWRDVQLLLGAFYDRGRDACRDFALPPLIAQAAVRYDIVRAAPTDIEFTRYAVLAAKGSLQLPPTIKQFPRTKWRGEECAHVLVNILVPRIYGDTEPSDQQLRPVLALLCRAFYSCVGARSAALPAFQDTFAKILSQAAVRSPEFLKPHWYLARALPRCVMHETRDPRYTALTPMRDPTFNLIELLVAAIEKMNTQDVIQDALDVLWSRLDMLYQVRYIAGRDYNRWAFILAVKMQCVPFWHLYFRHVRPTAEIIWTYLTQMLDTGYPDAVVQFTRWLYSTQPAETHIPPHTHRNYFHGILYHNMPDIERVKCFWDVCIEPEVSPPERMFNWVRVMWQTLPGHINMDNIEYVETRKQALLTAVHEMMTMVDVCTDEHVTRLSTEMHILYGAISMGDLTRGELYYDLLVQLCVAHPNLHQRLFGVCCTRTPIYHGKRALGPFAWIVYSGMVRGFELPADKRALENLYGRLADPRTMPSSMDHSYEPIGARDIPLHILAPERLPRVVDMGQLLTALSRCISGQGPVAVPANGPL